MLRVPGIPGTLLNPRGEITTGLAILRLTGLGHPRAGLTSPLITLRLRSEASGRDRDSGPRTSRNLGDGSVLSRFHRSGDPDLVHPDRLDFRDVGREVPSPTIPCPRQPGP